MHLSVQVCLSCPHTFQQTCQENCANTQVHKLYVCHTQAQHDMAIIYIIHN